jgi:hypothetical protein
MLKPDDIRRLPLSLIKWLTETSRLGTDFFILPSAEHSVFVLQKALKISRQQAPSKSVSEEANITGRPLLESAFRTVMHGLKGMREHVCHPPLMNRDAVNRGLIGVGLKCLGWTSSGERLDNLISSISDSLVTLITLLLAEISQLHENALQMPKEEWNTKVTGWRLFKKDLRLAFTLLELRLQFGIKDGSSHASRLPGVVAECDTEIHTGSKLSDPVDIPSLTGSTCSVSSGS